MSYDWLQGDRIDFSHNIEFKVIASSSRSSIRRDWEILLQFSFSSIWRTNHIMVVMSGIFRCAILMFCFLFLWFHISFLIGSIKYCNNSILFLKCVVIGLGFYPEFILGSILHRDEGRTAEMKVSVTVSVTVGYIASVWLMAICLCEDLAYWCITFIVFLLYSWNARLHIRLF